MRREDSKWWRAGFTSGWWGKLTAGQKLAVMDTLTPLELEDFYRDWRIWGRDNQLAPDGDDNWTTWLLLAGRGFGKTRTLSEQVIERERMGYGRMCLLGQGEDDVREVIIEGESGVIACAPRDRRPKFYPSVGQGRLEWPSGALAFVYSAADPEALRGPQFQFAGVDEALAFPPEARTKALSNLRFGLRLPGPQGQAPQTIHTTTPKPHRWLKELVKRAETDPRIRITRGSTLDNRANLAAEAVEDMLAEFDGTALGRQELYAEILGDEDGALVTEAMLDKYRIMPPPDVMDAIKAGDMGGYWKWTQEFAWSCERVVIGVDPNVTESKKAGEGGKTAHAAGIVVAGKKDGIRYTIADLSTKGGPSKWSGKVLQAYEDYRADMIVGEVNQGGDLIKQTLDSKAREAGFNEDFVFRKVRAFKGKARRAEPLQAPYEAGKIRHMGTVGNQREQGPLYKLEVQLCALHDGYDPTGEDFDRADANNYAHLRLGRKKDDDSSDEAGVGILTFGALGWGQAA
jgi:phage terminase large subunit-like protein